MSKTALLDTAKLVSAYRKGTSAYRLAKNHGVSTWAVLSRLRSAGVTIRPDGQEKVLGLEGADSETLSSLVDGLLLGDGSIDKHKGFLRVEQTVERIGWLNQIREELHGLGVFSNIIPLPAKERIIEGRRVHSGESRLLYSSACREMRDQRQRWYPEDGGKCVPRDLRLTPLCTAMWFCGDGTMNGTGGLFFCTQGFPREDVEFLVECLRGVFGIRSRSRETLRSGQFRIEILFKDEAMKLREVVLPHIPECCLYKFRFVRPPKKARPNRSLTEAQIRSLWRRRREGASYGVLSREFHVSVGVIAGIVQRRTYRDTST